MFVNLIESPPMEKEKEKELLEWFEWANEVYANFDGFISWKLLWPTKERGNYMAVMEYNSEKTFMVMHTSPEHRRVFEYVESLLEGSPIPRFYEVALSRTE